ASKSSTEASETGTSTGNFSACSQSPSIAWSVPSDGETMTVVAPASSRAARGLVSSTCSTPLVRRNAIFLSEMAIVVLLNDWRFRSTSAVRSPVPMLLQRHRRRTCSTQSFSPSASGDPGSEGAHLPILEGISRRGCRELTYGFVPDMSASTTGASGTRQGDRHGQVPHAQALPDACRIHGLHPDGGVEPGRGRRAHRLYERLRRSAQGSRRTRRLPGTVTR